MKSNRRPSVFISSTFREDFGGGLVEVGLRSRILQAVEKLPVSVWMYELIWNDRRVEMQHPEADDIVDRCFAGIKACDLFVFIVTGRHGSGAQFVAGGTMASYLELELFAAAILNKPILILHYKERDPAPALQDAMHLLWRSFGSYWYVIDDEKGLFTHFQDVCNELVCTTPIENKSNAACILPEGSRFDVREAEWTVSLLIRTFSFLAGIFGLASGMSISLRRKL